MDVGFLVIVVGRFVGCGIGVLMSFVGASVGVSLGLLVDAVVGIEVVLP